MSTADSNLVANLDASPPVMNEVGLQGGRERVVQDDFEVATTDLDAADIIRLARLPSNARITELLIANDDLDANGTPTLDMDLGLYDADDDSVLDDDCFAVADTQLQAASGFVDHRFNALGIDTVGQKLWEIAGLTEDPGGEMDIAITTDTGAATAAAGTIAFIIRYVID